MTPAPSLQAQAQALGDPTRHAVFRYVAAAGRRVDVAELTAALGLHHNGIRRHLGRLVDAGLVEEATAPTGRRGRPRLTYAVAPSTWGRWGAPDPYERLSVLLAEAVRTGDAPVVIGRRAGAGAGAGGAAPDDPVGTVVAAMAAEGFDPVLEGDGDRVDVVLRCCPFETAALADPAVVCAVHLGMAEGVAERTGGRVVVEELVRLDPRRAGCRVRLRVDGGGPG